MTPIVVNEEQKKKKKMDEQSQLHLYNQSFLLTTDAQENCFHRNIKIYVKIIIATTCFSVITIIRERTV